jgi:hypothetical protein
VNTDTTTTLPDTEGLLIGAPFVARAGLPTRDDRAAAIAELIRQREAAQADAMALRNAVHERDETVAELTGQLTMALRDRDALLQVDLALQARVTELESLDRLRGEVAEARAGGQRGPRPIRRPPWRKR